MSLVRRLLKATFVLGEGDFGQQGQNTVDLSGLRASANITKAGGPGMSQMQFTIYGMKLSTMNKLSTLGMVVTQKRRNSVTLSAGDDQNGFGNVFQGTIANAWIDLQAAPEVAFHVEAFTGLLDALEPADPISIKGSADVVTMLSGLATKMHVNFEPNGVKAKLPTSYFAGSPRDQAWAIIQAAGLEWNGMEDGILAIWNPGESRGGTVPVISPDTGMVGYPTFTSNGIMVQTLFNPAISFGGRFKCDSSLFNQDTLNRLSEINPQHKAEVQNSEWVVYGMDHNLETLMPHGAWFTTLQAAPPGFAGQFTP